MYSLEAIEKVGNVANVARLGALDALSMSALKGIVVLGKESGCNEQDVVGLSLKDSLKSLAACDGDIVFVVILW